MESQLSQHEPQSPHFRVLVADADADALAVYRQAFAKPAYDLVEASDGRDALTKALVRPPALVITELQLPLIDGFALCEILRRDRATAAVPIVVVTKDARPTQLERAEHAGADAVLVKPATPDAIITRAREVWAKSAHLHARSTATTERSDKTLVQSTELVDRSRALRKTLAKTHRRERTTTPPVPPPTLKCPSCDRALVYQFSHIGGVSARHPEQWDYFNCSTCGSFQYRQRTRKMRRLAGDEMQWADVNKAG